MVITSTKIDKIIDNSSVKAVASVLLDNELIIRNIKVIKGKKGVFVAFPNDGTEYFSEDGKKRYYDTVYPIDQYLREEIVNQVLKAYNKETC